MFLIVFSFKKGNTASRNGRSIPDRDTGNVISEAGALDAARSRLASRHNNDVPAKCLLM